MFDLLRIQMPWERCWVTPSICGNSWSWCRRSRASSQPRPSWCRTGRTRPLCAGTWGRGGPTHRDYLYTLSWALYLRSGQGRVGHDVSDNVGDGVHLVHDLVHINTAAVSHLPVVAVPAGVKQNFVTLVLLGVQHVVALLAKSDAYKSGSFRHFLSVTLAVEVDEDPSYLCSGLCCKLTSTPSSRGLLL